MPEPVLERLPSLVQNERNRDQFSVDFDDTQDVYTLPKAPVLEVYNVTGLSGGEEITFTEEIDYELGEDEEGQPVEIDWSVDGDSPDDGTEFVVDQSFETIINRYTLAHDEELSFLGEESDVVIRSHEIDNATGDDLDRVGSIFGELGRRRERDDANYRVYLKSIVQSFNGRGSVSGLKFAIASAIGTDPDNIEVIERFSELEYEVQIVDVDTPFISSAINDLAELADPSVVQLDEAIIVFNPGGITLTGANSEVTEEAVGLGGEALTLDGNSQLG